MTPLYGRAPRGERVIDYVPRSYGEQTSLIGALSFGRGLIAVMTLTGAVDTLAFDAYLARVLGPRLRKGDAAKARTRDELERALAQAIKLITKSDIRGWFKHCGYKVASV